MSRRPLVGTSARPDLPTAVVVGGGGLGLAVARRLGQRYRLVVADRDADHLQRVGPELNHQGYDVTTVQCDVTDPDAVSALAARVHETGEMRALAHVVGLSPSMADWREIMQVDLIGAALVDHAMLTNAVAGTSAVFISSLAAHRPAPDGAVATLLDQPLSTGLLDKLEAAVGTEINSGLAYSLAKWALNRHCRQRAAIWGARGARINSLSPGLIATPMGALEFQHSPGKWEILRQIPLRREGTMLEIADAVDFLVSDRASYINGIDLLVDGGVAAAMQHPNDPSRPATDAAG